MNGRSIDLAGGRVLVVDDERSMRLAMTIALRTDGWSILTASHAAEADQLFGDQPPQLVVLDYMLPETDGLALAQAWRRTGSKTPILLVSAQTDGPVVWRALKLGIIDMIAKPMEPDQLRRRVRAMAFRPAATALGGAGAPLLAGLHALQQQQPREALEHWQHPGVPSGQRAFQLLRAFTLQLARDPGAPAALAQVGWPTAGHLSGGADIFLEYCRRTDGLLSTMPTTPQLVQPSG